jgi:hypothetical protein
LEQRETRQATAEDGIFILKRVPACPGWPSGQERNRKPTHTTYPLTLFDIENFYAKIIEKSK